LREVDDLSLPDLALWRIYPEPLLRASALDSRDLLNEYRGRLRIAGRCSNRQPVRTNRLEPLS
jgi:hypothetical protein